MHFVSEKMDAVLYILAIADYDKLCFEDETTPRMKEALDLFKGVMEAGFFNKKTVILFFNKYDLFVDKIVGTPITTVFTDFPTAELLEAEKKRAEVCLLFLSISLFVSLPVHVASSHPTL